MLLGLLLLRVRRSGRLRLVGAAAGLLLVALGWLRTALQLLEGVLVERNARGMAMARGARREGLLLLLLSVGSWRDALLRGGLLVVLVGRRVAVCARLVDCECFTVSRTTYWAASR